jgi:hypothetical protein
MSDPGLMLGPIAYAYDAYWDGEQIGSFGNLARGRWFVPRWRIFPLPRRSASPGAYVIAIRVGQIGLDYGGRIGRLETVDNSIGDIAALKNAESALLRADFQSRLLQLLVDFALLVAGLYFLLLPPSVSQGAAFRWLGAMLLARALWVLFEFYSNDGPLDDWFPVLLRLSAITTVWWVSTIEFPYALFRRRVPFALRCIEPFFFLLFFLFQWQSPGSYYLVLAAWALQTLASIIPVAVAASEARKHTAGAAVTLLLFAASCAATLDNVISGLLTLILGVTLPTWVSIGPFQVWVWDAAFLLWVPAITMQVHKMNLRFRDEQERLRGEMQAARHVQELLVPAQSPHVPGFEVDASYRPATDVGGDFFQLFPASNDSLLVVIGDVSGKGMKAALLVSVIVGALQNRRSDQPGPILEELNRVLLGRSEGGFTTCCCARFDADGTLTIANAGHLAPYRNAQEIAAPPGLPLGVEIEGHWTEMSVELAPGDRVLWVSDGVLEARNGKRDLLGFERVQELAGRSASEIAGAAQQFGQEDDITVVSITRQPVAAYVT